jgi:hypothetical protein
LLPLVTCHLSQHNYETFSQCKPSPFTLRHQLPPSTYHLVTSRHPHALSHIAPPDTPYLAIQPSNHYRQPGGIGGDMVAKRTPRGVCDGSSAGLTGGDRRHSRGGPGSSDRRRLRRRASVRTVPSSRAFHDAAFLVPYTLSLFCSSQQHA